jgi:nitroreductase
MNFIETIAARRSIRKFTGSSVSDEQIKKLLTAGMNAPSARNMQPWHFMIIKNRGTIDSIVEICPNGALLKGAPVAIFVLGDLDISSDYCAVDCSAAVENILLAAQAEKLGACWIGVYPRPERIAGLSKLFNLPSNIQPHSLIAVGHPGETKEPNNRYLDERIHTEKW